jgi:polyhydroxyalkanoate synthesis repressor PhaR
LLKIYQQPTETSCIAMTNPPMPVLFATEPAPRDGVVIKKYANRRLYNTETSTYMTLEDLYGMVKNERHFIVVDAKTGNDLTRSVLTQIIFEQENKGTNLLPENFLRRLIRMYGDNMQPFVPPYLEHVMQGFASNVDEMRNYTQKTVGDLFQFDQLEELSKQNMAFYDRVIQFFSPFIPKGAAMHEFLPFAGKRGAPPVTEALPATTQSNGDMLLKLEEKINALQQQITELGSKNKT